MKVFIPKVNESWVVDKFREEFITTYPKLIAKNINKSDIVWIMAPWVIKHSVIKKLPIKKVIASMYHIDTRKKESKDLELLRKIDPFVQRYHTISIKSKTEMKKYIEKDIVQLPFWVNTKDFYTIDKKNEIRKKFNLSENNFVIGSFQRDSEGEDLLKPKLIKGPDIFIDIVKQINNKNKNLVVVLAGKRRGYIISQLEKLKIKYKYFEMISIKDLNELYNILNLYIVSSRLEGGPQAVLECATIGTPIISSDVGVASQVLSKTAIFDSSRPDTFFSCVTNESYAKSKVKVYETPFGIEQFRNMLVDFYES